MLHSIDAIALFHIICQPAHSGKKLLLLCTNVRYYSKKALQTLKDTFNFFYKFKFSKKKNRNDIFNVTSSF